MTDYIKTIQSRLKTAGISLTRTQIKDAASTSSLDCNDLDNAQLVELVEILKSQNKSSMLTVTNVASVPTDEVQVVAVNDAESQKSLVVRQATSLNIELIDSEVSSIVEKLNSVCSDSNDFLLNLQQAIISFVASKKSNFDNQVTTTIHQVRQATEDLVEHQNRSLEEAISNINKEVGEVHSDLKSIQSRLLARLQ